MDLNGIGSPKGINITARKLAVIF